MGELPVMDPLWVARAYVDAWNAHDAAALLATFAPGGTYADASTGAGVSGDALAGYANGLFGMIPDVHFDHVADPVVDGGTVVAQWRMKGSFTGTLPGGVAFERTIDLPGIDVIVVKDGRIRSVAGYFDPKAMLEQLGFTLIEVPAEQAGGCGSAQWCAHRSGARPGPVHSPSRCCTRPATRTVGRPSGVPGGSSGTWCR